MTLFYSVTVLLKGGFTVTWRVKVTCTLVRHGSFSRVNCLVISASDYFKRLLSLINLSMSSVTVEFVVALSFQASGLKVVFPGCQVS